MSGAQMYADDEQPGLPFGHRVRITRERLGIAQCDLARSALMTRSHLCFVESGRKGISVETLVRLSKVLGVTTDYLLGLTRTWRGLQVSTVQK